MRKEQERQRHRSPAGRTRPGLGGRTGPLARGPGRPGPGKRVVQEIPTRADAPALLPHLDGLHLLRTGLALLVPPLTSPTLLSVGSQKSLLQPHPLTSPHSLQPDPPAPDGALFSEKPLHGTAPAGSSPGIRRSVLISPPPGQLRHQQFTSLPSQCTTVFRS